MGALRGNVGKAYSVMDDQVRALEYAERASNGARELGLHQCLLSSLCDLGNAALALKDLDKSSAAFKEMAFWADSLNNQDFLAEADVRIADSYLAFEMPDSALKYALRGTLGMRKLESSTDVGRALVTEGKFLPGGTVLPLCKLATELVLKLWEAEVLALLLAEGRITEDLGGNVGSWEHAGFSVDQSVQSEACLLYTSPSPRVRTRPRTPSSA